MIDFSNFQNSPSKEIMPAYQAAIDWAEARAKDYLTGKTRSDINQYMVFLTHYIVLLENELAIRPKTRN